jgi:hypothetical protein
VNLRSSVHHHSHVCDSEVCCGGLRQRTDCARNWRRASRAKRKLPNWVKVAIDACREAAGIDACQMFRQVLRGDRLSKDTLGEKVVGNMRRKLVFPVSRHMISTERVEKHALAPRFSRACQENLVSKSRGGYATPFANASRRVPRKAAETTTRAKCLGPRCGIEGRQRCCQQKCPASSKVSLWLPKNTVLQLFLSVYRATTLGAGQDSNPFTQMQYVYAFFIALRLTFSCEPRRST